MKKVKLYKDYIEDIILEKIETGELPFILSERLIELLKKINHNVSNDLLNLNNNQESSKYTLVDYDDKEEDMFTYSTSVKSLEYISSLTLTSDQNTNIRKFKNLINDTQIWGKHRSKIKIGRLINKIFPDKYKAGGDPGNDISSFVDVIKSERTINLGNFIIVEGDDVVKYYHENMYEKGGGGSTLYGSCMKYDNCSPYIGFYAHNDVKLVVLLGDNNLVKGRALLWNIGEIDGAETDRKFLDRIYVIKNHDINKFKELAKKNEWLYKDVQDMWANSKIIDPKRDTDVTYIKSFNIKEYKAYPYMDTLKYFNVDENYLTNNENETYQYELESTDGGYFTDGYNYVYNHNTGELISEEDMIYSEVEDRFIMDENSVYSEYSSSYISSEYANRYFVYSDEMNGWIPRDESVYIELAEDYVSIDYAQENYIYCEYDDNWYLMDDSVPSEKWGGIPIEKGVIVIIDKDIFDDMELSDYLNMDLFEADGSFADVRYIDDDTYFTINYNGNDIHIDNSLEESEFVKKLKKGR